MWLKIWAALHKLNRIISFSVFLIDEKGELRFGRSKQKLKISIMAPDCPTSFNRKLDVAGEVLFSLLKEAGLLPLREENE